MLQTVIEGHLKGTATPGNSANGTGSGKVRMLALVMFLLCTGATAQERNTFFEIFRENYIVTGIPLNAKPDYDTNDVAFQFSVKLNFLPDIGGSGCSVFAGFTQLSIWDFYMPSNPFKESTYCPGLYFSYKDWFGGYEHRSNGRDGHDSRSLHFAFVRYSHTFGCGLNLNAAVRYGIGAIGNDYDQVMFKQYQGYCKFGMGYRSPKGRFTADASFVPLFKGDIPGNINAEVAFRLLQNVEGFYLFAKYHYGYDECQIDCGNPDVFLKQMLRFGFAIRPAKY